MTPVTIEQLILEAKALLQAQSDTLAEIKAAIERLAPAPIPLLDAEKPRESVQDVATAIIETGSQPRASDNESAPESDLVSVGWAEF